MKKLLLIAALGIALLATAHGAFAQQDSDMQSLLDRITRLERDMSAVRNQAYRGGDDNGPPAAGPSAAGDEMRFEQLGDQMRELTGRLEEVRHDVSSLQTRMDKLANDVDIRLQALEHPGAAPAMNNPPEEQQEPPQAMTSPLPPRNLNGGPPPSRQGGFNGAPPPPPPPSQNAMAAPPDAGLLPNGTPQQQYDYAFGLLRDANYQAAEHALKDFVARYPNNRLSSNAQYWLGETFFVRGRYQAAAAAFAEGYQKYPKGPKAADDLLKLGSSLSMLNRKADACRSFAQLDHDFPIAAANLKAKEADEKRKAGCR
jgi:tol-pal system protein YbgF